MSPLLLTTHSPDETERVGRELGRRGFPGLFVALQGELGGGKTCFTRGVVAAAAPQSSHMVASPTFAIMNSYSGDLPVYHFDLYRLFGDDDVAELGFEEYFHGDGISIVEWSERLTQLLPPDRLTVSFAMVDEHSRSLTLTAAGPQSTQLLEQLTRYCTTENFL